MPNIPNKEDELQIVKCFGEAQVYDGGWHAEYDGKWIDITNEVYNVKRLMEAREKSIREEAEVTGASKASIAICGELGLTLTSNGAYYIERYSRLHKPNTQVNKGEKNGHA